MSENNITPNTTEELYNMLLTDPNLVGKIELVDGSIIWNFKDFWINAFLDVDEGYVSINRNTKHWWEKSSLLHWHPMKDEIYNELAAIGNRDNVLVIRTSFWGSGIFYLGRESEYKFSPNKKRHWGKLHYLKPIEQNTSFTEW